MMAREDYNEIRAQFDRYLECMRAGDAAALEQVFDPECKCFLSTVKAYPDGGQHSLYGISDFVRDRPQADEFHIRVCNYICNISGEQAHQTAAVVCRAVKYVGADDLQYFEYTQQYSNAWQKTEQGWRCIEMRMDLPDHHGDFSDFSDLWFYEEGKAKWFAGVHLPCISGELDSPWVRIPEPENVLTDEEQILAAVSRYAFGIDTVSFSNLPEAISKDIVVNMAPWGAMDYREFIATLKYHRQPDRYWTHPCKLESCEIHGDAADLRLYRMSGHRQRNHPLVLTRENCNHEFACARYEIKMKRENGAWKIARLDYLLGIIDLGEFEAGNT